STHRFYLLLFSVTPPPAPPRYTLSLHDALPISTSTTGMIRARSWAEASLVSIEVAVTPPTRASRSRAAKSARTCRTVFSAAAERLEEHTSELQSRFDLVCRLLLEKKKVRKLASQ